MPEYDMTINPFTGEFDATLSISGSLDLRYLKLDGSNANTNIDIGAFDLKATSFSIGANTLTTSEFAFLDGQNQSVLSGASPTFDGANFSGIPISAVPVAESHIAEVNPHIDWTNRTITGSGQGIVMMVNSNSAVNVMTGFSLAYYPEEIVTGSGDTLAQGTYLGDTVFGNTDYTWLCHANLSSRANYATAFGIGLHGEGQRGVLIEQSYATNTNGLGGCLYMIDKFKTSNPGVLPWIDIWEGEYNTGSHTWSGKDNLFRLERNGVITGKTATFEGLSTENNVLTLGSYTSPYTGILKSNGLNATSFTNPASTKTTPSSGIAGYSYIMGANFGTNSVANAFVGSNATFFSTGGSSLLDLVGFNIAGAESPLTFALSGKDVFGGKLYSAKTANVTIAGNATTLKLYESLSSVTGSDVILHVEKPTQGATNYQAIFEGNGAGSGIWFDSAERIYSDGTNLCVAPSVVAETNISVGTDSPSAGFRGTGDIYATSGIKAMEGLYSEAVAYGAGLEVSDNSLATTYTNAATPTATLTASTQTIYDPNATFTDAYIGQFVKVITSDAPSYTGATGDIVSVTDSTHIIVSFGSTGGDAITDATGMSFVIYPSPNCYVSDNGDIKFKVGASDDASFKISSPTGNNDHAVHVVANAGVDGHGAVEVEIDADNKSSVSGFGLKYDATGYVAGISGTGLNMIIDNSGATGGDLHGIDVKVTDTANTDMETVAVGTNAGVDVIHQHLGTAAAIAAAFTYDLSTTTYTDVTAAFAASGSNVQMFTGDNDEILIGSATKFDQVNVILAIGSSKTITPTFEYIEDDGDWVAFTPSDDTSGFQNSGTVRFDSDNLATWGQRTVNEVTGAAGAVDYYWVKITRTRNFVATPPTESTIEVTTTGTFHTWDSMGRLGIKTFSQATEPDATDLPANLFCFWIDTDDSKLYICYNAGGTIKTTELT